MNRPPRLPGEGIFNRLMVTEVLISSLVMGLIGFVAWYYFINTGWNEDNARNMAVLLFVLLENVHIFNCRSEHRSVFNNPLRKNLFLLFSVIAAQSIHQIAMHIPILQNVLGLAPVSLFEWLTLFGLALIIILVMEIFKAGMHRKERLKSTGTTGRIIPG